MTPSLHTLHNLVMELVVVFPILCIATFQWTAKSIYHDLSETSTNHPVYNILFPVCKSEFRAPLNYIFL